MFAAAFGLTAAVGAAPAMALPAGENIFGSGSSLQKIAQQNVWTGKWTSTAADHAQLSNDPTATYTSSSSGGGLDEFGNNTGALDLTKDPTADAGSTNGYGVPVLDAYVGTDDPPTSAQIASAESAATGGAAKLIGELTIPVAQAPVAILISAPTGITIGKNTKLTLTNALLRDIWDANVPASAHYAGGNDWGALLEDAGLKKVTGTPAAAQFRDAGGSTGGTQAITLQVRSSASGTSYTLKGFLNLSGDANYPSSFVVDDPTWPVTTVNTGNTGGSQLVADTTATPGSVGYANLADAHAGAPSYTNIPVTTTTGGTHQVLYAKIQANQGGATPVYADPAGTVVGAANVYTGNNININGGTPTGVGHWTVPLSGTTLIANGSWGGTLADDPDVYDHAAKVAYYPIVAATYDLAWGTSNEAGSNLVGDYGGTTADATAAGNTAHSYLAYVVASAKGQTDIAAAKQFYAKLPAKIDTYATTAATKITP